MNKLVAFASLLSLLLVHTSVSSFVSSGKSVRSDSEARIQIKEDKRRKDFAKAKGLLVEKKVPFDPEIMLTPHWRKTLKSTFDQMPELQQVRRGRSRLNGVEMAHTLYLPEKVRLEGDTVILTRNLIFEGNDAVMPGCPPPGWNGATGATGAIGTPGTIGAKGPNGSNGTVTGTVQLIPRSNCDMQVCEYPFQFSS
jgi:hypothetical protein